MVKSSVAYSSTRKSGVERGGAVRALRSHVEAAWGNRIHMGHPAWPWFVEDSAFLLNRAEWGMTARRRARCARESEGGSRA